MRRFALLAFGFLGMATMASFVQAEPWQPWHNIARDFHRNNCWPEPFCYQDRQAAVAPFGPMIDKGWEHQNMLTDHHFEADSKTLTQAGRLKVQWILSQAPAQYKTLYVQRSVSPETTATRVDTVQQAAAALVSMGDLPQVVVSGMEDPGHPADYIDSVSRKFQSTVPDPRLPKASSASDSGSGGGK